MSTAAAGSLRVPDRQSAAGLRIPPHGTERELAAEATAPTLLLAEQCGFVLATRRPCVDARQDWYVSTGSKQSDVEQVAHLVQKRYVYQSDVPWQSDPMIGDSL